MSLVLGEYLQPERRQPGVPHHPDADLLLRVEEFEHHAREAVEGIGGQPAGRRYALRQRVERSVEQRVSIDEVDAHSLMIIPEGPVISPPGKLRGPSGPRAAPRLRRS